ncbi:MAG: hypothetical protein K0R57_5360 [Paenibacillaceae bacterium]|jgi:two-component system sensor histidine kinase YesM|nr:hypothetical protein [Paenibacillaceae bacterium]
MILPFFSFLKKSFYMRMILIMLGVSVIPLILLSWISITVSSSTVEKQVNRLNGQLVNQVVDRIELSMSRFREVSDQYSRLPSIQGALVPPSPLYYDEVVRKRELISVLSTASAVIGNVEGLQVYSAVTGEILSNYESPSRLEESPYKPIIEHFLASGSSSMFLDKGSIPELALLDNATFYIRRIPYDLFDEMTGALLISMNNSQYQRQIENIQLGAKGSISLLTPDGISIATTSKLDYALDEARIARILQHWRTQNHPDQFVLDASLISVKQTATYNGWIVLSEIPSKELTQSAGIIRRTVSYFLLFLIILGVLSIFGFGYQLYRPLQEVRRQVEALKKGRFDARVTRLANNEIGELGRMLNSMAARIQELVQDQQVSDELKRKLEIRALQSQINPHFMYNTLNTIRMFAMMKDYDKINSLMGRLVSLLRYSMENYEQTVLLQQELDYLRDYIELLNMRYKCQINLECEIEPSLLKMHIPKLGLQPLIENSVFHGILPKKTTDGRIVIRACTLPDQTCIMLEVEDDGIGMEEEELKRLQVHLMREEPGENIGLKNVWMRLKLMFGQDTRVELYSESAAGSSIRFLLPIDSVYLKGDPHEPIQGAVG